MSNCLNRKFSQQSSLKVTMQLLNRKKSKCYLIPKRISTLQFYFYQLFSSVQFLGELLNIVNIVCKKILSLQPSDLIYLCVHIRNDAATEQVWLIA